MTDKPLIFLSYSRKDKEFVDEIIKFIRPIEKSSYFQIWHDGNIEAGDDWHKEIDEAIDKASIAIIFVSPDYLASEWLNNMELPQLIRKQDIGKIRIIPIIIRPAAWAQTPLAYLQVLPRDGRALSELSANERDRTWLELSNVLTATLHRLEHQPEDNNQKPTKSNLAEEPIVTNKGKSKIDKINNKRFFISHAKEDGDFAENLKSRMTEVDLFGWVDIDVLEAGVDWRKEIDDAILNSKAIILILSPDSKVSEYVTYEWAFGLGSGLRIIPLLLRSTPIHPRLEAFQYLDFTNRHARPWPRLFALLQELSEENK